MLNCRRVRSFTNDVCPVKCPIQKKLVDVELLTAGERAWLDRYHAETLEKVAPLLQNDPRALEWLKRECSSL